MRDANLFPADEIREPEIRRPGLTLSALIWEHFVNDGMANYLPGILPLLLSERHFSVVLVSSLMSLLTFAQMVQPIFGTMADRMGGRLFMLMGPVASAVGGMGVAYFPSVYMVLASLVLIGIGNNVFHPQALSTARKASRAGGSGLALSAFLIGGEVGRAVAPMAAGAVAVAWGLNHVWVLALPVVVTWPILMRWVPRLPPAHPVGLRLRGLPFRPALKFIMYAALRSTIVIGLSTFMPLIWRAEGGQVVVGASLVTVFVGVGILGNVLGGAFADRVGPGPVVWVTTGLMILLLLGLRMAHGFWMWPLLAGLGIVIFAPWPSTIMAVQDIFHANPSMGSGIGLGLGNGLGAVFFFPLAFIAGRWGVTTAFDTLLGIAALVLWPVAVVPTWRLRNWKNRGRTAS